MSLHVTAEISIGDLLTVIGLLLASSGLLLTWIEMRRSRCLQSAEFRLRLIDDLLQDSELRAFFYKIDYEEFKFSWDINEDLRGCDDEQQLDALLYRYDSISQLIRSGLLTMEEVEFVVFEIAQVMKNHEVQRYIDWLDQEYEIHGSLGANTRRRAHDDTRWLVETLLE